MLKVDIKAGERRLVTGLPAQSCGLDFGTSNSTVAVVAEARPHLVPIENDNTTIPSAVFFSTVRRGPAFGREAIRRYTDGEPGRFMRAIKSILGHGLFHEETPLQGKKVPLSQVLTLFLRHLKAKAEQYIDDEICDVVLGRPVQFIEGNPEADQQAQRDLQSAARGLGFRNIEFQYEPIAAALDYEQTVAKEQIVFVVDIGGGTADFSIVKVSPTGARKSDRYDDILANKGIRVGGTDFDRMLSIAHVMPLLGLGSRMRDGGLELPKWIYYDLATWSQIPFLYSQKTMTFLRSLRYDAEKQDLIDRLVRVIDRQDGHRVADTVEHAKIALTAEPATVADLMYVEPDLGVSIDRSHLGHAIEPGVRRIEQTIAETVTAANLASSQIQAVFLTGGSSMIPVIRDRISRFFGNATLVHGDMFGSVGKGLGLDAFRKFR
jgi:hypothetical chaperone protein